MGLRVRWESHRVSGGMRYVTGGPRAVIMVTYENGGMAFTIEVATRRLARFNTGHRAATGAARRRTGHGAASARTGSVPRLGPRGCDDTPSGRWWAHVRSGDHPALSGWSSAAEAAEGAVRPRCRRSCASGTCLQPRRGGSYPGAIADLACRRQPQNFTWSRGKAGNRVRSNGKRTSKRSRGSKVRSTRSVFQTGALPHRGFLDVPNATLIARNGKLATTVGFSPSESAGE